MLFDIAGTAAAGTAAEAAAASEKEDVVAAKQQAQGRDFWWLNVHEKWAFVPAAAVPEALSRVDGGQLLLDKASPGASACADNFGAQGRSLRRRDP